MFVRNGEALGSVRAEPKVDPQTPEPVEGEPVTETPESEHEPETEESVETPKPYDSKAEWVAFVVASTAGAESPVSEEDAEDLTKAELIELYGGTE